MNVLSLTVKFVHPLPAAFDSFKRQRNMTIRIKLPKCFLDSASSSHLLHRAPPCDMTRDPANLQQITKKIK